MGKFVVTGKYPTAYEAKHASRTTFDSSFYDEQFNGSDYWDTYQGILNQYADGPSSQWFGFLGADAKNAYNHNQARSNALNALLEQKRADEYNDPTSQVAREKAAGLNPDLTGLSDVGQTDSAIVPNEKEMQYENPIPHIVSFMSMLGNAAIGAQSMLERKLINDGMRLTNLGLSKDLVLDDLSNYNPFDMADGYIKPAFKLGYDTGSRSVNKKLENLSSKLYGSVAHELSYRGKNKDIKQIRKDVFDITSSAGYSDDDEVMSQVAQTIADMQLSAMSASTAGASERKKIWSQAVKSEKRLIGWLKKASSRGNIVATKTLLWLTKEPSSTSSTADISNIVGAATAIRNPTKVVKTIK